MLPIADGMTSFWMSFSTDFPAPAMFSRWLLQGAAPCRLCLACWRCNFTGSGLAYAWPLLLLLWQGMRMCCALHLLEHW